jgi:hypothetical protein
MRKRRVLKQGERGGAVQGETKNAGAKKLKESCK